MEHNDERSSAVHIPVVQSKEGEMVTDIKKTEIPASVVVRMGQMEAVYEQMQINVNCKF